MFKKYFCQVSKPSDVPGGIFFQKSDGRQRLKEDFLHVVSTAPNLPHCYHGVPYWRSRRCMHFQWVRTPRAFCSCRSTSKFLDFSLCFLSFELLCLTMSSPSDFSFKVKEQLFEQTFCHLIFPVRGKSIVDSLWKSSSPVSTSEIEFTRVAVPVEANSHAHRSCLVSSQGVIA